ncbi:MAG: tRNA uridine(34) 5-carboxymethylaminomethyl modification radical SAM/GNAT enzyme Elp3 [Anaerolineales bacterium]|jgi:elongator complex protein 3
MHQSTIADYTYDPAPEERLSEWRALRDYDDRESRAAAHALLTDLHGGLGLRPALHRHPAAHGYLTKDFLLHVYREMVQAGELPQEERILRALRMKPVRTLSGVATITVLTKPYPCPGECLFCPTDARMPKSYLHDEPGAMRAEQHHFDPYEQTAARLESLEAVGHPTGKVELLILGGTWTAYPRDYQARFVQRCLDALNGGESSTLAEAQERNAQATRRNVGLVIETRPDRITPAELRWLRSLGVTKVQIGVQSTQDRILELNQRGHTLADTRQAFRLLRAAGFKIQAHWMPNLLGADEHSDRADFAALWSDLDLRPDELKIYPTSLLRDSKLFTSWERGEYHPYSFEQLIELLVTIKPTIPRYCRVSRLVRDIPAHHVVAGNRRSNLREEAQRVLASRGLRCQCIRCREIRGQPVRREDLRLEELVYRTGGAEEHFLSFVTCQDRLAGYLRLSLPHEPGERLGWPDLREAALIREIHIYGQSLEVGDPGSQGAAQHVGLGSELLSNAETLARRRGYTRLAVISAIGTRGYYAERGFLPEELYQVKPL